MTKAYPVEVRSGYQPAVGIPRAPRPTGHWASVLIGVTGALGSAALAVFNASSSHHAHLPWWIPLLGVPLGGLMALMAFQVLRRERRGAAQLGRWAEQRGLQAQGDGAEGQVGALRIRARIRRVGRGMVQGIVVETWTKSGDGRALCFDDGFDDPERTFATLDHCVSELAGLAERRE